MTRLIKTILTVFGMWFFSCSNGQDLKTFTGTIDYKFHLSGTHTLKDAQRKEIENDIEFYAKREKTLTNYFNKLSSGDNNGAKRVLGKDKDLKEKDDFTLAYMFALLRMKQLKILYSPCIQVNDEKAEGIIISCTTRQFEEMKNSKKEFQLECRYVGELIVDNTKAYELVSFR